MAIYLLDFENVHDSGISGVTSLTENAELCIFYSVKSEHMSFETHVNIMKTAAKVKYIKLRRAAKNYLDFQLCTHLGYIIGAGFEGPFYIISKDTGYDSAIDYWKDHGVTIIRQPSIGFNRSLGKSTGQNPTHNTPPALVTFKQGNVITNPDVQSLYKLDTASSSKDAKETIPEEEVLPEAAENTVEEAFSEEVNFMAESDSSEEVSIPAEIDATAETIAAAEAAAAEETAAPAPEKSSSGSTGKKKKSRSSKAAEKAAEETPAQKEDAASDVQSAADSTGQKESEGENVSSAEETTAKASGTRSGRQSRSKRSSAKKADESKEETAASQDIATPEPEAAPQPETAASEPAAATEETAEPVPEKAETLPESFRKRVRTALKGRNIPSAYYASIYKAILNSYDKLALNNLLVKTFGSSKGGEVYKQIKEIFMDFQS